MITGSSVLFWLLLLLFVNDDCSVVSCCRRASLVVVRAVAAPPVTLSSWLLGMFCIGDGPCFAETKARDVPRLSGRRSEGNVVRTCRPAATIRYPQEMT